MLTALAPLRSAMSRKDPSPQLVALNCVASSGAAGSETDPTQLTAWEPSSQGDELDREELDFEFLFGRALYFQRQGDPHRAISEYTSAIELDAERAEAYINRGAAYQSMGELDLALEDFDRAVSIEPSTEAYNNRGNVFFARGDHAEAAEEYGRALELYPDNVGARIYRGHSFRELALYGRAIREYGEALAVDPGNAEAITGTGDVHSIRGDHDEAIRHYDEVVRIKPHSPYAYLSRGVSHFARGDVDRAEDDFRRAGQQDPDYPYARHALALIWIDRGDNARALRELDGALQLVPDHLDTLRVRGSLHLEMGSLDAAIQDLDRALELDPQDADTYCHRGLAYQRKNETSRAMRDYDAALDIGPSRTAYANRGVAFLGLAQWDRARSDLLSARHMGLDLGEAIRPNDGGIAALEEQYDVDIPQDIVDMITLREDDEPAFTAQAIDEAFEQIRDSAQRTGVESMPSDGARNYRYYLYGWPRREEGT